MFSWRFIECFIRGNLFCHRFFYYFSTHRNWYCIGNLICSDSFDDKILFCRSIENDIFINCILAAEISNYSKLTWEKRWHLWGKRVWTPVSCMQSISLNIEWMNCNNVFGRVTERIATPTNKQKTSTKYMHILYHCHWNLPKNMLKQKQIHNKNPSIGRAQYQQRAVCVFNETWNLPSLSRASGPNAHMQHAYMHADRRTHINTKNKNFPKMLIRLFAVCRVGAYNFLTNKSKKNNQKTKLNETTRTRLNAVRYKHAKIDIKNSHFRLRRKIR